MDTYAVYDFIRFAIACVLRGAGNHGRYVHVTWECRGLGLVGYQGQVNYYNSVLKEELSNRACE